MNQRSTICSGVVALPRLRLGRRLVLRADLLGHHALTSSHTRYVPSALAYVLMSGMLALMYDCARSWLPLT